MEVYKNYGWIQDCTLVFEMNQNVWLNQKLQALMNQTEEKRMKYEGVIDLMSFGKDYITIAKDYARKVIENMNWKEKFTTLLIIKGIQSRSKWHMDELKFRIELKILLLYVNCAL